jgi:hypothetical protein
MVWSLKASGKRDDILGMQLLLPDEASRESEIHCDKTIIPIPRDVGECKQMSLSTPRSQEVTAALQGLHDILREVHSPAVVCQVHWSLLQRPRYSR